VARVHVHPRSMGPKMDSLLYAILGSDRQILKGVEAVLGIVRRGFDGANSRIVVVEALSAT
jgi:hypothetical protein